MFVPNVKQIQDFMILLQDFFQAFSIVVSPEEGGGEEGLKPQGVQLGLLPFIWLGPEAERGWRPKPMGRTY
jgi:hypothetical protein